MSCVKIENDTESETNVLRCEPLVFSYWSLRSLSRSSHSGPARPSSCRSAARWPTGASVSAGYCVGSTKKVESQWIPRRGLTTDDALKAETKFVLHY